MFVKCSSEVNLVLYCPEGVKISSRKLQSFGTMIRVLIIRSEKIMYENIQLVYGVLFNFSASSYS